MARLTRFLLARFLHNRESFSKAKVLLKFSFVEFGISAAYFIFHPYLDYQSPRLLYLSIAFGVLLSLWLFRLKVPFHVLAHFNIALLWIGFCVGIFYSGGIESPVVGWLAVLAVMANLMIGQKAAYNWLGISLCTVLLLYFNQSPANYPLRSLGSNIGLIGVIFLFTYFYQSVQNDLVRKIKSKTHKLEARKNRLILQHAEILKSKSVIEEINKKLHVKIGDLTSQSETLERHWQTLLDISKSYIINFGKLEEAVEYITRTTAQSLGIDRVSIWRYLRNPDRITCLYLYDSRKEDSHSEADLILSEFPHYYEALKSESVIPVIHARTDSTTSELKKDYLLPRRIEAMMDTPFFLDGDLGGVLCCEHGNPRDWTYEDILFAIALSEIITLSFKAQERRAMEEELFKNQEEIVKLNRMLEGQVREQSEVLDSKNKQLEEYTYLNSHMLRAPLSRLLGWVGLLNDVKVPMEEKDSILAQLREAGHELDTIVAKINEALNNSGIRKS